MLPADEYRHEAGAFAARHADHGGVPAATASRRVYALEGSVAITGALVQWVRDNFGLIEKSSDIEALARTVKDNGGVYFVPAFSGLYAPYWKDNARGVIAGLTRYTNKGHLARAVLEATAFQTREVVEAMEKDSGIPLDVLRTDGGMVDNDLLMQFQADILDRPVVRLPPGRPPPGRRLRGGTGRGILQQHGIAVRALVGGSYVEAADGLGAARADVQALEESGDAVVRLGGLRRSLSAEFPCYRFPSPDDLSSIARLLGSECAAVWTRICRGPHDKLFPHPFYPVPANAALECDRNRPHP